MVYLHCPLCGTTIHASLPPRSKRCPRCLAEGEYPVPELVEAPPREGEHPDIDVVRRAFQLLERGQLERMIALFAEDFEGRPMSTRVVVRGRREADEFLRTANAGDRSLEPDVYRFERNGQGQVGVFGRLRVMGPEGLVDTPAAWIYSVQDGKIARADAYTSMAEAQKALYSARV